MSTSIISIVRLLVTFQPQIFTTWTRLGATVTKERRHLKVLRHDQLFHNFEDTDGDHTPFHVTNALTTCANGTTPIPPFLIHSNPGSKNPNITSKYAPNITSTQS